MTRDSFFGISHVGCKRDENQDAFRLDAERGLFAVADGMGGTKGGKLAAELSLRAINNLIIRAAGDPGLAMAKALCQVSSNISKLRRETSKYRDMGSTITVALLKAGRLYLAHAGDSRAYLLRDGHLKQLTEDHSVAEELARAGALSKEQAERHPMRHQLTKHVGQENLRPSLTNLELRDGDLLLLATDGLYGEVNNARIGQIMSSQENPQDCCQALIQESLSNGGRDNVTAVVVDCSAWKRT